MHGSSHGLPRCFWSQPKLQKGEKALRIVDFLDNIAPKDEERTIADGGNTKILVSYGPKKPTKLEQISISQWVVGNTRIVYNLLASNKLGTQSDVQNYLTYSIMELSNRYQWVSVLTADFSAACEPGFLKHDSLVFIRP